jgi:Protein of unknown function (DUF1566)
MPKRLARTLRRAFAVICGALCVPVAQAAEPQLFRLAVVELRNEAELRPSEIAYLTDLARTQGNKTLPAERFLVMTRESIVALLPPGKTLADCAKSQCEVEVGRAIGADYIVTGEVLRFGEGLRLNLKVHACGSGAFLGSESAKGLRVEELELGLVDAGKTVFASVLEHAGVAGKSPVVSTSVAQGEALATVGAPNRVETVQRGDLMWMVTDNQGDVDWFEAKAFCESCRAGGHADWRLPQFEELGGLYEKARTLQLKGKTATGDVWAADAHIAEPFRPSSPWLWSGSFRGTSSAYTYSFETGWQNAYKLTRRDGLRVMCVRSGTK